MDHDDSFIWVSEFTDEELRKFYTDFTRLETDSRTSVVPIIISSYGGSIYILTAMRDIIKTSSKPVATIVLGRAMSAGAILLASGSPGLRFASKEATIMLHEGHCGVTGKAADIKNEAKQGELLNKRMFADLAEDTGLPVGFFLNKIKSLSNTDWYLTAEEAKKIGIIDVIDVPRTFTPDKAMILVRNRKPPEEEMVPRKSSKVPKKLKKA